MQPFVVNRHDRIVFPSNFIPELDLSVIHSVDQLDNVIRRDFEMKAPTGTDILTSVRMGAYESRYELMRDLALNLFWVNRFAMTLYDKRPTRWADVPRTARTSSCPSWTPWEDGDRKIAAVAEASTRRCRRTWDGAVEDRIFGILFDVFGHRKHHASTLPTVKPTVAEIMADPANLHVPAARLRPGLPGLRLLRHRRLRRGGARARGAEPVGDGAAQPVPVGPGPGSSSSRPASCVTTTTSWPSTRGTRRSGTSCDASATACRAGRRSRPRSAASRSGPYPAVNVREQFTVLPRIEALAVVHGELACTNEDLIRNAAYNWSPMCADEIREKTGIEERRYTSRTLEEIALEAAQAALEHAGRGPEEIGAVLVCTCTSTRLIPSVATCISGQLGIYQTHASYDIIAACAGMPYGLAEATRILQEVQRPVLVVCVEKFSDKIGNVRPSRMIFADGAAAVVLGVAPPGGQPDIEFLQTYASGPASQVNSIIWPNPAFDNNITVYGPEVKALAGRYLVQMIEELKALPDPDGAAASLLESIDLIVPHQANKTMVIQLRWTRVCLPTALLQHRKGRQRVLGEHPPRHPRRGARRRHHATGADLRSGVRGRRGRWLLRVAHRSGHRCSRS